MHSGPIGQPPVALDGRSVDDSLGEHFLTDGAETAVVLADDLDRWSESSQRAFIRASSVLGSSCSLIIATIQFPPRRRLKFGAERISLRSLTLEEARDLVRCRAGVDSLPPEWMEQSEGNPGALMSIAAASRGEFGHSPSPLAHATREALRRLSPPVRRAAEVAAAAEVDRWETLEACGRSSGDFSTRHIERLEQLGILEFRVGGELRWLAPGLRHGVRSTLSPGDARRIARHLADCLDETRDPAAVARLLAASATGTDARLAGRLRRLARHLRDEGELAAATDAFIAAAATDPDPVGRTTSAIRAAVAAIGTDRVDPTVDCLVGALRSAPFDRRTVLWAAALEAAPWMVSVPAVPGLVEQCCDAGRRRAAPDVSVLLHRLFVAGIVAGVPAVAASALGRLRTVERLQGVNQELAGHRAIMAVMQGTPDLGALDDLANRGADDEPPELAVMRGWSLVAAERHDAALELTAAIVARARRANNRELFTAASVVQAESAWRRGEFRRAADLLADIVASDTRCTPAQEFAAAVLARVEAMLGDEASCRRRVATVLRSESSARFPPAQFIARIALAHLDIALGDADTARASLRSTSRLAEQAGILEPGQLWSAGDLIDALSVSGTDGDEAALVVAGCARHSSAAWTRGVIARTLARRTGAPDLFAEALAEFSSIGARFEVARTLLDRARRALGRDEPDAAALQAAETAVELCFEMGARPSWHTAMAVLGELRQHARPVVAPTAEAQRPFAAVSAGRVSVGPTRELIDLEAVLTGAEYRVALAVGTGASNREAAARLIIGVRTVDTHLRSIFRKLGLRSRVELACLLTEQRIIHLAK